MLSFKKLAITILLVFISLFLIWWFSRSQSETAFFSPLSLLFNPIQVTPAPTSDPLQSVDILILGYAGKNHDGGNLADTIMLAHINPKTKNVTLISIPRDLWVPLPIKLDQKKYFKINHAWAIGNDDITYPNKPASYTGERGGINLTKEAINTAIGLRPDYVLAVNFDGFLSLIDLIGPLTVQVPYSFDDYFYPVKGEEKNACGKTPEEIQVLSATVSGEKLEREFTCRYEHLHFNQGLQVMDSETALKFVRSRHSEIGGGDFGRANRQQALINAIKDQLLSPAIVPKLPNLIDAGLKSVRTDLDINFYKEVLKNYRDLNSFTLNSLTLNQKSLIKDAQSADHQYILIPVSGETDFSAIHQFIAQTLTATVSASPAPTPVSP